MAGSVSVHWSTTRLHFPIDQIIVGSAAKPASKKARDRKHNDRTSAYGEMKSAQFTKFLGESLVAHAAVPRQGAKHNTFPPPSGCTNDRL